MADILIKCGDLTTAKISGAYADRLAGMLRNNEIPAHSTAPEFEENGTREYIMDNDKAFCVEGVAVFLWRTMHVIVTVPTQHKQGEIRDARTI